MAQHTLKVSMYNHKPLKKIESEHTLYIEISTEGDELYNWEDLLEQISTVRQLNSVTHKYT